MSSDFLGKGLRFPFAFARRSGGAQVSTVTSTDHAHIHESILQILGTRPGERFMNPEFGAHIRDLVFEPNDSVLKGLLRHYIIDAIERFEKRVYVTTSCSTSRRRQSTAIHYMYASHTESSIRRSRGTWSFRTAAKC